MRCSLLFAFLPIASLATGQSWSPPGATWTYGLQDQGVTGYARYTYVGDTLLHDTLGQRIDLGTVVVFEPEPEPVVNTHMNAVITSYANEVVSVWDPMSEHWDTLFWFGAQVNDFWQPPHYEGECGENEQITVEATGTMEEDGVILRWLDLANGRGRIIERAGWIWNLEITPSCLIVEGLAGQRCYTDDEINYTPPTWTADCFAIGIGELHPNDPPVLYPNPGTDNFIVQLPARSGRIILRDVAGRALMSGSLVDGTAVLDGTALPPGPYAVFLMQGAKTTSVGSWIKR